MSFRRGCDARYGSGPATCTLRCSTHVKGAYGRGSHRVRSDGWHSSNGS